MKRARTFGQLVTLSNALGTALERRGWDVRMREQLVLQRWADIVGEVIAQHAQATRIVEGTLWVQVRDAAWRQELLLMRGELITCINTAIGASVVQDIRFR
ncbi:MAG TPA: DUF721 domain-containing protein [Bacteroidota bacterium]|nr:DUF721 domain-containing protein [Bacteroidota bacterium]